VSTTAASQQDEPVTVLVDDPTTVDTLRGQIDALDAAIARLVGERAQLSRRIQNARMNAGGTRVELGRERAIVNHYRKTLGSAGPSLAEAVLRVCRGAH
jgi:chorismate mutase